MADQQELVEQLFDAALAMDPAERRAYLDRVCGDNLELRRSVDSLLIQDERAGSFLEHPPPGFHEKLMATPPESDETRGFDETEEIVVPSAPPIRIFPGDILGDRFLVIRYIAKGGMGEVYEVEDLHLQGVRLALKTVLPQVAGKPSMQRRFEREVLLAREVIHPNLCPIYDIFHVQHPKGTLNFLTMKLLSGETLASRLARQGRIDLPEATSIIKQVATALAAIHDAGILHRDIKASNIMLDGTGEQVRVCVMDFGLAHPYLAEGQTLTAFGMAGTPAYMAPELFRGEPPSKTTDVYAFGVVVYEMLVGKLPPINIGKELQPAQNSSFKELPPEWQQLIRGCLEPDTSRRYQTIQDALTATSPIDHVSTTLAKRPISRRHMIEMGTGASLAVAGGIWFEWPKIDLWIHPLPEKRFVALMAWPTATSESEPIVSTVLGSIRSHLARAEAYVKNLLIITSNDVASTRGLPMTPSESVNALGANLVLAASLQATATRVTLLLQVLDAASQHLLRKQHVSSSRAQVSTLADKGSAAAATLLGLPSQEKSTRDTDELQDISAAAFASFSQAEEFANQPNNTGLDAAILKYGDCLEKEPHFRLGYAKLAMAYTRKYRILHDPALLTLARQNAEKAADANSNSAKGLLSRALVYLYTGDTNEAMAYFAKALKVDPGNPEVMLYRAQALRDLNRWPEAEQTYRDILKERPNYWPANNELGWILFRQAKYVEAADAFDAAGQAAPNVALPMANLGSMYIELKRPKDAEKAANDSVSRHDNFAARLILGDVAFGEGNYKGALDDYTVATKLNPKSHLAWRNVGDCHAMLGHPAKVRESYANAANLLAQSLQINPRSGPAWMNLAFYHAKIGDNAGAATDIKNAESRGATDVESQFMKVQTLAVLGKKEEATKLLLTCMDRGLSTAEVDLALDLKDIRKDPRYLSLVAKKQSESGPATS
jgi:serine/threonine protein kinase/Tfp pilus assembly protein PilF